MRLVVEVVCEIIIGLENPIHCFYSVEGCKLGVYLGSWSVDGGWRLYVFVIFGG